MWVHSADPGDDKDGVIVRHLLNLLYFFSTLLLSPLLLLLTSFLHVSFFSFLFLVELGSQLFVDAVQKGKRVHICTHV